MSGLKRIVAALMLLAVTACAAQVEPVGTGPAPVASAELRRGVNVLGYDPIWEDPARARFQERHFAEIRRGGFDFIRVNLHAFRHMDAQNRLPQRWFDRLDWIVRKGTDAGLAVILDEHDFEFCGKDADTCRTKLTAFWRQVAPRYRNAPKSVLFELLNEPHGQLDAERWNALSAELLAIVRETNPTRTVVIGPTQWNNYGQLATLRLPQDDRNILVTFHYYEPFRFTHQGASWAGEMKDVSGVAFGESDKPQIRAHFQQVAEWARANDRPVMLGEFGAYDMSGTPAPMRADYTATVAREAERHGFSWAYWQFDSNFLVWDMDRNAWVEPIHRALVPEGR
jgi:endoglucanase